MSQTRSLSGFDTLEAGLIFDLAIRQGEDFRVVLIADDNWVDYLATEMEGTTLSLSLKDGYAYNFSDVTMKVEVSMPELAGLNLNGSSRATLEGFQEIKTLKATLSGSSFLGGELVAKNVSLDLKGSSAVQLFGSSDNLRLEGCGNSMADLSGLEVIDAKLDMACSSRAIVQVDGRLEGEAAQNSQILYVGQPTSWGIIAHEQAYMGQK